MLFSKPNFALVKTKPLHFLDLTFSFNLMELKNYTPYFMVFVVNIVDIVIIVFILE